MGWRFQRRINTGFGRINFSKSGVSLTEGVPGAHVTLGKLGVRTTIGLPGSGVSWTSQSRWGGGRRSSVQPAPQSAPQPRSGWTVAFILIGLLVLLAVISAGGH